jgi:hypothetical protein
MASAPLKVLLEHMSSSVSATKPKWKHREFGFGDGGVWLSLAHRHCGRLSGRKIGHPPLYLREIAQNNAYLATLSNEPVEAF